MNNILGFLRIPLVRFIGAGAILYFALFSNKHEPESLRNRLSKERIDQNLHDIRENSRFIVSNVKAAQNLSREKLPDQVAEDKISIEDIETGTEEEALACGSEAEISYQIFLDRGPQIKNVDSEKIIIGSNVYETIEKNILNMRRGGIRNINVPKGFVTEDPATKELLRFYNSGIRYQIYLLSLKSNPDNKISCK